jgi:drug/metabolite transporter (DMT)-like permease
VETSPNSSAAWIAAFTTVAVWGSAFTGIKIALDSFGPGPLSLARFGVAVVTLWLIACVRPVVRFERADWPRAVVVSLVGITVYHFFLNTGQRTVSPGIAALLIQTAPVFTSVLAARFGGEVVTRKTWFGIMIAAIGTAILVVGRGSDLGFSAGALLIVACAVATSVYFVFGRPLVRKYGARSFTTWTMTVGTLPFLVFAPGLLQALPDATRVSSVSLLYIGVLPAALAYILWNYAIGELGAARVSLLLYLSPVVAIATEWAWFGTLPSVAALFGGATALVGTAVATRG